MTPADEIIARYRTRVAGKGKLHAEMRLVREAYNGEMIVPLPELDRNERSAVANLIATGTDQLGMRIASTVPNIYFPPVRPGDRASEKRANTRRRASVGWLEANKMGLKMRRRARHLIAYSLSPVVLRPDFRREYSRWELREPLSTYEAPSADLDEITPSDCIFAFPRSYAWLKARYPDALNALFVGRNPKADDIFDLLEYVDGEETVLLGLGKQRGNYDREVHGTAAVELERIPNRTGVCPAIVPSRITLDRPRGLFSDMPPMMHWMAKLMALELRATEKGVFPDSYLVSRQGETAQFVSGPHDGRTGMVNIVKGGDMKDISTPPGFQTNPTLDRLAREARFTGGIPPEFGGECADVDTQILTTAGWKSYDKVSVGDEVLTLDHDTGMSQWQPIQKMNVFEAASRTMMELEGTRHSSLTTLNHRWPVVRRSGDRARDVRVWRHSNHLTSEDQIPIAAMHADLPMEAKYSDALVEVVAWYWTEGTTGWSSTSLAQSTKNAANVDRIRAALRHLFGPAVASIPNQGKGADLPPCWRETAPSSKGIIDFRLSATAGRIVREFAPGQDKVPTFEFLRALTAAQLELFIGVSMLADNCGPDRLGQKVQARTEAFAFAVILSGRGVSYQKRITHEDRSGWRSGEYEAYLVRIRERRFVRPAENASRGSSTHREVPYSGVVWCPTTENGTWFARRNGSTYFTGNSQGAVRTGKRGDAVLSAVVDFPVQEAQELLAASMQAELKVAIAQAKTYWGSTSKSFYVNAKGSKGNVDYTPNKDFENDNNTVTYSQAGSDANALVISGGQRVGIGTLSKRSFMELDPLVDNVELEHDRVISEALEAALMSGLQQQAQSGQIAPSDLARIMELVLMDKVELAGAVQKVHEEAQARQAADPNAAPGAPDAAVDPASAAAQPGLAMPGAGAEAGTPPPTVGAPAAGAQNLASILSSLRQPERISAAEKRTGAVA